MKINFLKYASLLVLAGSMLVSCDEDTVTFSGSDHVQFTEAINTTVSVTETAGVVSIPVSLATAQSSGVTVNFTVTSDTAVEGVNYNIVTPSVVFAAGETDKNIQIQIINDEDFNLARVLTVTLTAATNNVVVGLSGMEGASVKTVSITNDDYDCDTDFNYWLGNLTVQDGTTTVAATGAGGADCDLLTITGDLAGWGSDTDHYDYAITFVAGSSSSEGTVSVDTVVDDAYVYSSTQTFIIRYTGDGTYDTTTGEITIDYVVGAYIGTAYQGAFYDGTAVIKLAQ